MVTGACRDCATTDTLNDDRRCDYCAELWQTYCTLKPPVRPGQTIIRSPSGFYFAADLSLNRYYHLPDDTWICTLGNGTWQVLDLTTSTVKVI